MKVLNNVNKLKERQCAAYEKKAQTRQIKVFKILCQKLLTVLKTYQPVDSPNPPPLLTEHLIVYTKVQSPNKIQKKNKKKTLIENHL